MFPNQPPLKAQPKQNGNMLIIVVFIIVVMSIIGVALVRVLSHSATATVTEVYGASAHHAAQSGIEVFLTELFPLDQPVAADICPVRDSTPIKAVPIYRNYTFNSAGLSHCSATIQCDSLELTPYTGRHFRILSVGACQVGKQYFSRQLLVEAQHES